MSFLSDYAIVASGNEVPALFHKWAGISAMSHIIGRRVWMDRGGLHPVFLNLYCIFVSDPGVKKSTAMFIASKLVEEIDPLIQIAGDSETRESLLERMGKKDSPCIRPYVHNNEIYNSVQMSIFANEIINLIFAGGEPAAMLGFLIDIWDKDPYRNYTKSKGKDLIHRPFVTILGCMTKEKIKELVSQKIVSDGMTRRCIFVYGKREGLSEPILKITPEQIAARKRCVETGRELLNISGSFSFSPDGADTFVSWYHKNTKRKDTTASTVLSGVLETKPELVQKLAMILALDENPTNRQLNSDHITNAVAYLDQVEMGGVQLFEGIGRNPLSSVRVAITQLLDEQNDPINIKFIYNRFASEASVKELDEVMDGMSKSDTAVKLMVRKGNFLINYLTTQAGLKRWADQHNAKIDWNAGTAVVNLA